MTGPDPGDTGLPVTEYEYDAASNVSGIGLPDLSEVSFVTGLFDVVVLAEL